VRPHILIISKQFLERFVPALEAIGVIRACHQDARIKLLTTANTSDFAMTAPYFDDVWNDDTGGHVNPLMLWALGNRLKAATFERGL
jgi:hypothetical protein